MLSKFVAVASPVIMLIAAASPAAAQTFSGPRVEARVGIDGGGISLEDTRDFGGRGDFGDRSNQADIALIGEAGFDIQSGRLVFGGYATYERSQVKESFTRDNLRFETGRNITAGARAGLVVGSNVLIYGKAGYSNGRLKPEFITTASQANFNDFSKNRNGVHFGGGIEIPVETSFYVKFDYTHTLYKDFQVGANQELRFDRKQLTGGIGYRF